MEQKVNKNITGWNVKVARKLIDKQNSTDKSLRICLPIEKEILVSLNVPKKFVTDNNKKLDYVYVWMPKQTKEKEPFFTWSYVYSKVNNKWELNENLRINFSKIVSLLNKCYEFTRNLLKSIKNGLNFISEKMNKQITEVTNLAELFFNQNIKAKEAQIYMNNLNDQNLSLKPKINNESKIPIKTEFEMEENLDINWD